jgi:hypothetical protein
MTSHMSVVSGRPAAGVHRDMRLDQRPLLVGNVAGIRYDSVLM